MHHRFPRIVGALGLAIALLTGQLVSSALGATPTVTLGSGQFGNENVPPPYASGATPSAVSSGNVSGFYIWAQNDDTSTISQFYLASKSAGDAVGATWFRVDESDPAHPVVETGVMDCPVSHGSLACSFGQLKPMERIYVTAAFITTASGSNCFPGSPEVGVGPTGTSYMCVDFQWTTTGTPPDKNGRSHGDAFDWYDAVDVGTSNNFGSQFPFCDPVTTDCTTTSGGYLTVLTTGNLSSSNAQTTRVEAPPQAQNSDFSTSALQAADGEYYPDPSCTSQTCMDAESKFFGEWSWVVVNDGTNFQEPGDTGVPIHVVLQLYRPHVHPNQVDGIYHQWNDASGSGEENIYACPSSEPPANGDVPCFVASRFGGQNLQIDVWMWHNGPIRGW